MLRKKILLIIFWVILGRLSFWKLSCRIVLCGDLGLNIFPGILSVVHIHLPKWRKYKYCFGNSEDRVLETQEKFAGCGKESKERKTANDDWLLILSDGGIQVGIDRLIIGKRNVNVSEPFLQDKEQWRVREHLKDVTVSYATENSPFASLWEDSHNPFSLLLGNFLF